MNNKFQTLNYNFILGSASPRRQQLLKGLGLEFEVKIKNVKEDYPVKLKREHIALFLCELKANAFSKELEPPSLPVRQAGNSPRRGESASAQETYTASAGKAKGKGVPARRSSPSPSGRGSGGGATIVITADTIVWLNGKLLKKPLDFDEAVNMLKSLSGRMHEVITAVCLKSRQKSKSFFVVTKVYFKQLTTEDITYYVTKFKPYDKAGGYGIQEWIGSKGIKEIKGSYFNVMGLPLKELYEELMEFC